MKLSTIVTLLHSICRANAFAFTTTRKIRGTAQIDPFIIYFFSYLLLLFLHHYYHHYQQLSTKNRYNSFSRSRATPDKITTTTSTIITNKLIFSFVSGGKKKEQSIKTGNDEDDAENTLISKFVSSFVKVVDREVHNLTTIKFIGIYCSKFNISMIILTQDLIRI